MHRHFDGSIRAAVTLAGLMLVATIAGCGGASYGPGMNLTLGAVRDSGLGVASSRSNAAASRRYVQTSTGGSRATYASDVRPVAPDRQSLRVMSANIRVRTMFDAHNNWPHRRRAMIETIRQYDPDVLGIQESLLDQTEDLQRGLPGYEFTGVGRDDGKTDGEMCGVFFKSDRFLLLDEGHFWLSTKPDKPGSRSWGAWFPRLVTWVRLSDRQAYGREFFIFNTHFSHADKDARLNSAKLLRERMRLIAGADPVIITGDFNARESSPVYDVMVNGERYTDAHLVDTYRDVYPTRQKYERTHHAHRGGTKGERIDWILVSSHFGVETAAIDHSKPGGRLPSDHYPVTAVVRWNSVAQRYGSAGR